MSNKQTGRALSVPGGLAISAITGIFLTLIGSGVIAQLINTQILMEKNIGYAVMVMLIITAYISAMVAWQKIKHRRVYTCVLSGCVYFAILMAITALFFGGQYSSVWETALLILCGSGLATMHKQRSSKRKIHRLGSKAYR